MKPVIQISFLDFSLFEDEKDFCSTFMLANTATGHVYTNKFAMTVVYLPHIDKATDDDKSHHVNEWALMFKAKPWEDLKMLAEKNADIEDAVTTTFQITQDELLRQEMERREEFIIHERAMKEERDELISAIADKDAEIADKDAEIADKDAEIADKDAEIARLKALLAEKN